MNKYINAPSSTNNKALYIFYTENDNNLKPGDTNEKIIISSSSIDGRQ